MEQPKRSRGRGLRNQIAVAAMRELMKVRPHVYLDARNPDSFDWLAKDATRIANAMMNRLIGGD